MTNYGDIGEKGDGDRQRIQILDSFSMVQGSQRIRPFGLLRELREKGKYGAQLA